MKKPPENRVSAQIIVFCLTATLLWLSPIALAEPVDEAKKIFDQYTALEKNGDPALVDLYSQTAKIKIYKAYKDGSRIREAMELAAYKEMLKAALSQKITYVYSDTTFTPFGSNIKIKASRLKSGAGKKAQPYSHLMTVGPDADGQWRILEETPTIDGE